MKTPSKEQYDNINIALSYKKNIRIMLVKTSLKSNMIS
jgi:hypothetical protein